MKTHTWKRVLSLVLTFVMVFQMIPVQAFAADSEETHDHEHIEEVLASEDVQDDSEQQAEETVTEPTREPTAEPTVRPTEDTALVMSVADEAADEVATIAEESNFQVGSSTYATLTEAVAAAGSSGTIVLLTNYTLPAGTYTIPSGVTLLIPFDSSNTVYTTKPGCVEGYVTPTAYRTLTMASGAEIVVNGAISLSAKQSATQTHNGSPTGPVSFINMASDSKITVKNGGALYAWGYITGSGSVVAESGASIYEDFQLKDWRGGNATSGMVVSASTYHVFPMSQYYVQNIEVPLTLYAGAIEKAYMSAFITMVGIQGSDLPFVGEDGSMFKLTSGYIVKDYIEGTGRLRIDCYGDVSVTPITLEMQLVVGLGIQKLNTADMVLGINGNMTVDIHEGSINIEQDLGLLPGSEFYIREGVTCTLTNNKKVIVYDVDDWGNYVGATNQRYIPLTYVPGGNGTEGREKDALLQIDGTVNAMAGSIYTTAHGANVYSTGTGVIKVLKGTDTHVYQAVQQDNYIELGSTYNGWTEIPVNPVWLKNADGSYTKVTDTDYGTMVYKDGRWHVIGCTYIKTVITAATCTEDGKESYTCSGCKGENTHTYEVDTAALGHNEIKLSAVAATCTETGLTEGKYCSRCDYKVEQTVIPATGHNYAYVEVASSPATCEQDGTDVYRCSNCSGTYSETKSATGHDLADPVKEIVRRETCLTGGIYNMVTYCKNENCDYENNVRDSQTYTTDVGDHTPEVKAGKAATCTESGLTDGYVCSVCKTVLTAQTVIDPLGHDMEILPAVAPTCETDGYTAGERCKNEGCTQGTAQTVRPAIGHAWDGGAVTKVASCSEEGIKTYTCANDTSHTKTEVVEKTAHLKGYRPEEERNAEASCTVDGTYDEVYYCLNCEAEISRTTIVEEEAWGHIEATKTENYNDSTCSEEGSYDVVYYCTRTNCGAEISRTTETIAKKEHTPVTVLPKSATCTEDGIEAGSKCSVCDTVITGCVVIPATGHAEVVDAAVAATCTTAGLTEGSHCSSCEEVIVEQEEIPATGHSPVVDAAVAATCTTAGLTEGSHCSSCEEVIVEQEEISATGHTEVIDAAVKETCTESGLTEGKHCSVCNEVIVAQEVIPAAHVWNVLEGTEPTCTEKGYGLVRECTECGEREEGEEIAALGHTEVIDAAVAPTCTTTGLTEGKHCSVCNEVIVAQEEIGTIAHTEVVDPAVEETCVTDGLTQGSHCSVCGEIIVKQETVDNIDGHTLVVDAAIAATCTTAGLTEGKHCSACDTVLIEQKIIPATNHEGTTVVHEAVAATCTEPGLTEGLSCTACNTVLVEQKEVAAGHTEVIDAAVAETCTTAGLTEGKHCSVCNEVIVAQEEIPATGHTPVVDPAVEPTCEEIGLTEGRHCSKCKEVFVAQEEISALGHTEVIDAAVEATCTTTGLKEGKHCSVCNKVLIAQEGVPALGHTSEAIPAVKATCTETGLTEGQKCSVCDIVLEEQTEIPATGHIEVIDAAVAPTCTAVGLTEGSHCTECRDVLVVQEEVPALGHTEVIDDAVAPTCTLAGFSEGKHCSVCNAVLVAQEYIKPLGHTPVAVPAVEPTCTEDGLTEGRHCDVCKVVVIKQNVVLATGHTEVIDLGVEPTCTETGLTEGKHCSVCEDVIVAQEEIPALGHTEETIEAVEPTCEEVGYTEGMKCSVCDEILNEPEEVEALGHDMGTGKTDPEPTCEEEGLTTFTCAICKKTEEVVEPALGHELVTVPAQAPTYTEDGWEEYERCVRDPENCTYHTKTQEKIIPAYGEAVINNFDDFIENLAILENLANEYKKTYYSKLSAEELVIRYIRTGVDRYNSFSWQAMAGSKDENFEKYVKDYEDANNEGVENYEDMMKVTGLKNLTEFNLPNGDNADIGHIFGTLDISITNKTSQDHADVAGWAGDTVDLLTAADNCHIDGTGKTVEQLVEEIRDKIFLKDKDYLLETYNPTLNVDGELEGTFSQTDIDGDLDGFYIFNELMSREYTNGTLTALFANYMTPSLTNEIRAEYFLRNRLDGVSLRSDVRDAVYNAYVANTDVLGTLENTRVFENSTENINNMRKAACYVVADYLCKLAGDWVEEQTNPYIAVYNTVTSELAPGVTQKILNATTADGKRLDYYIATADVARDDVSVHVNYKDNDPYISQGKAYSEVDWAMRRVLDQANAAQARHSDPTTESYVENYNVVAAVNGTGFNMNTGEPSDLLVMEGVVVHTSKSFNADFFGMKKDGTAVIGTRAEYDQLLASGELMEAISSFGTRLVKDGEIYITSNTNYFNNRAPRTAIGITKTGKVVMLAIDGRQDDNGGGSAGAAAIEIAQIMLDAGCWQAINLDGGGSTTYVAKQPGTEELAVINSPSDGIARSVASSMFIVSTAPSSTEFDHAVVESDYTYLTAGSTAQLTARAVSATGNAVDMPEGVEWAVSDTSIGTITAEGVFTAKANGEVKVNLMLEGEAVGTTTLHVVIPNNIFFTKDNVNAIYGHALTLPIKAVYDGKDVSINTGDITITLSNEKAGVINGFDFIGDESSGLRKVTATAALNANTALTDSISISMYREDEASFDFENATGGDAQLAYIREVSNATHTGNGVYMTQNTDEDMVTSYTFAIDMSRIEIPSQLKDLTYMLPGSDLEGASAWKFLLQLAERISNLTNVEATLKFDTNMDVDISNITVTNEYFKFGGAELDEETNTVKIKMQWIDQGKPIDEDSANPLCILTGIKLTPKDSAKWSADNKLKVENSGEISYAIYLGTSTLYTFASNPENQEIYGLYPYENDADTAHPRGGYFADTYKEFKDSYTLINAIPEGWVMEGGGWAYYEDGNKYTGICYVEEDGLYYDFGSEGVNIGQIAYTGEYTDTKGDEYYIINGKVYKEGHENFNENGWIRFGDGVWRYYNPQTGIREGVTEVVGAHTCVTSTVYTYTSESGAEKVYKKDATGHEYALQPDGTYVCTVCFYRRIEMSEVTTTISGDVYTYTGKAIVVGSKAVAPDGYVLTKAGSGAEFSDYYTKISNNIEVGTASVLFHATRVAHNVDHTAWRGTVAGTTTMYFEIRPDLPTDVKITAEGSAATLQWTAAKAPDVTYVIYMSKDGETYTEYGTTTDTSYSIKAADKNAFFKIGTRKVGLDENSAEKMYESVNKTNAVSLSSKTARPDLTFVGLNENGKPKISWSLADETIKSYRIYYSTDGNRYYELHTVGSSTSYYVHSKAVADTTYYYRIKFVYANGTESMYSNTVSATAMVGTPSLVVKDESIPALEWTKTDGASKYTLYRADSIDGEYKAIRTQTGTYYKDTTTKPGCSYYYKVVALSAKGKAGEMSGIVAVHKDPVSNATVERIKGKDRYATSFAIAQATKEQLGINRFSTVIIANGKNFADALAGSYLAKVKTAPIIMASGSNNADIRAYLDANLVPGGKVYILGGTGAIPGTLDEALSGYDVQRLKGKTRYETNIEILKEAGVTNQEIIVATGSNFADSLSASAVGKPILLVDNKTGLTDVQKAYLNTLTTAKYYIVGGTGAVSEKIETEFSRYGIVERIKGKTRYETSIAIANRFFTKPKVAVLAFAENFPDGLSGGPLSMSMNAPLILTKTGKGEAAEVYVGTNNIAEGYILGGASLIDDATAMDIFNTTSITLYQQ